MESKATRNDPCPCGSGKKYKRCCQEAVAKKDGIAHVSRCGNCMVCCHVLGIEDLSKGAYEGCRYNIGHCGLFDGDKEKCRDYKCLWLALEEKDVASRPDNLKVLFEYVENDDGKFLVVRELVKDVHKTKVVKAAILKYSRQFGIPNILVYYKEDESVYIRKDIYREYYDTVRIDEADIEGNVIRRLVLAEPF